MNGKRVSIVSVLGNNYIKTEIKSYKSKTNTNSNDKKVSGEGMPCLCLSLILLESVVKANKKCHAQTLLEEYKYEMNKRIRSKNLLMMT